MPFHQPDAIRYFTFDVFTDEPLTHAVFTRRGGVSPKPWDSLNVGGLRGDDPQRVLQNRILSFMTVGREPESVYDVWQVHSADVIATEGRRPEGVPHRKADAILTDRPEVTLFMRFADCVPILLYDPVRQIVGITHAGWLGTVRQVVSETIKTMISVYRTNPKDILAAIGPSIAPHHYIIGQDVKEAVIGTFGNDANEFITENDEFTYFDLWAANEYLLRNNGVRVIDNPRICTACHPDDWYSHRGENGQTGRFGVLLALKTRI